MKNAINKQILAAGGLICAAVLVWLAAGNSAPQTAYDIAIGQEHAPEIAVPSLPDLSKYTTASVEATIPDVLPGRAEVRAMGDSTLFPYLSLESMTDGFAIRQDRDEPVSIELASGVFDFSTLAGVLNDPSLLERTTEAWVLKAPVIVGPSATLVVRGQENALKLSKERGAFIASFGKLYIVDTSVQGWQEEKNRPAAQENEKDFRPYIVSWSGSRTWIAGSRFENLGYRFTKAYGVSFASSLPMQQDNPSVAPPEGWIVNSSFSGLYYGFYGFEASNVAIVNNIYKDNIVYGIDPHGNSRNMIIAANEISGTKQRHGITLAQDVQGSWVFGNRSHDNAGSGIVLDNNCGGNIVMGNAIERNGGDGLSFFESSGNIALNNVVSANAKSGIRVRNSLNTILRGGKVMDNGLYGIAAYASSPEEDDAGDEDADAFEKAVSLDLEGVEMTGNLQGQFQFSSIDFVRMSSLRLFKSPNIFRGDLADHEAVLYEAVTTPGRQVFIRMKGSTETNAAGFQWQQTESKEEREDRESQDVTPASGDEVLQSEESVEKSLQENNDQ